MQAIRDHSDCAVRPRLHDLLAQRPPPGAGLPRARAQGRADGPHAGLGSGRGMDFAGLRAYQPGDDLRSLDWRHTARSGRPYTKVFDAERERPVLFLVDLGATMQFGTRGVFKCVQAARVAALLAWAAAATGDRVGGVVLGARGCHGVPPRRRDAGVLALLHALTQADAAAPMAERPGLDAASARLARMLRPGSEVVLISDFASATADRLRPFAGLRHAARRTLIRIADPLELEAPPAGRYPVATPDGAGILELRSESARAAYTAACAARSAQIAALASALRANLLTLGTADSPLRALAARATPT